MVALFLFINSFKTIYFSTKTNKNLSLVATKFSLLSGYNYLNDTERGASVWGRWFMPIFYFL